MKTAGYLSLTVALLLSCGCGQGSGPEKESAMTMVPDAGIEALAAKKVLFAHMSVGNNILRGIQELKGEDPRLDKLKIIKFTPGMNVAGPGIYHLMLGNNSFPEKKVEACDQALAAQGAGGQFDILAFKFCYVDFTVGTDVQSVFSGYRDFVARTREKFPNLTVVHVTVPLTVKYSGLKGWVKHILSGDHPNRARSSFNQLLEKEFGGSDAIFDIARAESTDAAGNVRTFSLKGKKVPCMLKEYTDDGGHLNRLGRARVGREFIRVLAGIN